MNRKMVFNIFGRILSIEALLLLLPTMVALIYREYRAMAALLAVAVGALLCGLLIHRVVRPKDYTIYAKEGFATVALAWIGMSAVGALPFTLSGEIPSFVDAFFETVSGFTTTGASILPNVEALSHGMLFWRSFTHWVGGMGVLVFVMAVLTNIADRSIHIMRAEMPGPIVGKLVPRVRDTAKILYLIYIAMTLLEIFLLAIDGMPLYDSIVHAFGTAGTGGFGIKADSIAGYSAYAQIVIAIFMLLFGVNFNLYYLMLVRRFRSALRSTELWLYLALAAGSTVLITLNILSLYPNAGEALRHAFFQVSSIMTTTGYATADFDLWPSLSKGILLMLMCIGACAGSTGGGLKVSRLAILFRMILREFRRLLRPRSVNVVVYEGKEVDDETLGSVSTYFAVYVLCILLGFLAVCFEPFGFESNFSAVIACFNNIGPGFGAVGPTLSYAGYTAFSKLILSALMLLGRLEIFPLIIALSPSIWRQRH